MNILERLKQERGPDPFEVALMAIFVLVVPVLSLVIWAKNAPLPV
ncbi:hypothetical protein [Maritalea mediterranea]|nr:hypothetical protein [Maritalea mediterranea]